MRWMGVLAVAACTIWTTSSAVQITSALGPQSAGSYAVPRGHLLSGATWVPAGGAGLNRRPSTEDCAEQYFLQTLDHFSPVPGPGGQDTYLQRYFICDQFWRGAGDPDSQAGADGAVSGPIFLYVGNEADVGLYVNATGLMWENAEQFGALLLFVEHRYYGKSLPYGRPDTHREYLSTEQALADCATLVTSLKANLSAEAAPVVGFGGSYGGVLATWLRMKYPHIIAGAIAASAPILGFEGLDPPADFNAYADSVTRSASAFGGAAPNCADNVRAAWPALFLLGETEEGRQQLAHLLGLCEVPATKDDVQNLAVWVQDAFNYLAMGNFPYPSSYIMNGVEVLPAWPLREACRHLEDPTLQDQPEALLPALAAAIGVYYNASGLIPCFDAGRAANNESRTDADNWNYQVCTEVWMPFSCNGKTDMFWPQPWEDKEQVERCQQSFGVIPRQDWPTIQYGGRRALVTATNIVFSNGELDPWAPLGVTPQEVVHPSIKVLLIKDAAHHLDLMFSDPGDTAAVKLARQQELQAIQLWIRQYHEDRPRHPVQMGLKSLSMVQ